MKRTVAAILSMSFALSVCSAFQAAAADDAGGFDMSQMGGMDWSQMGGAGGFDMSQMGGGDAGGMGGMDWSQFTGGDAGGMGGMDWSQFTGGDAGGMGGMDWSQFTGGDAGGMGGMDWSQFTGGQPGGQPGGTDWSQFTGEQGGLQPGQTGGETGSSGSSTSTGIKGDANGDRKVDKSDVTTLQGFLLGKVTEIDAKGADFDGNNKITSADLSALKDRILNPPQTSSGAGTVSHSAKEYNAIVAADFQRNVPQNVKSASYEKAKKVTYFSKKANRNKSCNVWTPPGYDPSNKYPVMFMSHGVMGNEDNMLSGWGILEMATSLINSGDAVPFIIVFPQMYTDAKSGSPMGINMDVMDAYDDFVYDVRDSLYPYICENYSVATGRENTAVAGFSMGGRESLYLGLMLPDMIGYVCASSPAPGIVPASDAYIANHLGSKKLDSQQRMTNNDFKFSDEDLPYILMIGGGTSDQVVGTFPKQYHELFDKNGTTNVWEEFAGAGHDAGVGTPLFYNFFRYVFKA